MDLDGVFKPGSNNPGNKYIRKVSNRNTRKKCEVCLKLTIKKLEQLHWSRSYVLIVNSNP